MGEVKTKFSEYVKPKLDEIFTLIDAKVDALEKRIKDLEAKVK